MSGVNEFSKFVRDLAASLRAEKILYLGCHDAEDLSEFPPGMRVSGVAESPGTLERIVERHPSFEFRQASPSETPYGEGQFDFVFAHKLFNYLESSRMDAMIREMYRISSRYIANFEMFSENGGTFDGGRGRYCGMYSRWLDFRVRVISNVRMHGEIDPERCQFTLVRKVG